MCKFKITITNHDVLCSPHYKAEVSEFDNKTNGYTMSSGRKWTLKTSKKNETTPGPIYDT